jgi:beta-phosphoglucomutase-like phosphatase (HAD superfamily)
VKSNLHLVVFDIDGTLTDTNLVDGECYWRAVCEVLGLSGDQPDWSNFRHVTDAGIATELCLRHLGRTLEAADTAAIARRLAALLELALVHKDPIAHQIPGSAQILSNLTESSDFAVALATGALRLSAELKLRRAGLVFDGLPFASSNDAISREDILRIAARRAAEKYGVQLNSCTYVGDGIWDVKAARELGWWFIGIGGGDQAELLRQAGAATVLPDYRSPEIFLTLLAEHKAPRL